jgi:hypothetical protein
MDESKRITRGFKYGDPKKNGRAAGSKIGSSVGSSGPPILMFHHFKSPLQQQQHVMLDLSQPKWIILFFSRGFSGQDQIHIFLLTPFFAGLFMGSYNCE